MVVLAAGSAATEGERSLRVTSADSAGTFAGSAGPVAAVRDADEAGEATRRTGLGAGRGRSARDGGAGAGVMVTGGSDPWGAMSCARAAGPASIVPPTKTKESGTPVPTPAHPRNPPPPSRERVKNICVAGALGAADERSIPARNAPQTSIRPTLR